MVYVPRYTARHTPAPWTAVPVAGSDVVHDVSAGPTQARSVQRRVGTWHESRGMGHAAVANLAVLLAAPAMLELLIELERDLTTAGAAGQPLKRIRAVIEQASAVKTTPGEPAREG